MENRWFLIGVFRILVSQNFSVYLFHFSVKAVYAKNFRPPVYELPDLAKVKS